MARAKKAAEAPEGGKPARKAAARKNAAAKEAPAAAAASTSEPPLAPGPGPAKAGKTHVVFPMEVYNARKDEIKAPFKKHGLKWKFLGEGKGRYLKEGVDVFVQFGDEGAHYALSGSDRGTLDAILAVWKEGFGASFLEEAEAAGDEAAQAQDAVALSEEMRIWQLGEPQRRAGEPDYFFQRRTEEWRARKPT